ncbi:non-ribosomal peptide synthetase [Chitinophaga tropicalis]|uniref:Amino acid adenylation domain-containing protein n=1 Tax=Chitinophaga tropicalis TaxID=2683588 RepID=A0A7K1UAL0_9BACT|nr:non-ribosomal peptide synthase/polyketide synthase [Chitinophaga tropicalis]MVT11414.1 amino acid adenylation domain-containing protein [Chitinophaga tropicalis]
MKKIASVQEPIWLTQHIYTGSTLYNVGGYACIDGGLEVSLLQETIEKVLQTADVTELGYYAFNEPGSAFSRYDMAVTDLSGNAEPDRACMDWMYADMNTALDTGICLLKVRLLKASENRYYWYTKVHHLVFDGYSMSLFFNKVAAAYSATINRETASQDNSRYFYEDFILEDIAYKNSEEFRKSGDFWEDRLKQLPDIKAFQSCFRTGKANTLSCSRKQISISRELYNQLGSFSEKYNCTAFHYFIATLFVLNKCYNNNEIPLIGIPVFNRRNRYFKNTLGTFVNMLPFSISLENDATFTEVLVQVKNELRDCYRHQRFPLYETLKRLDRQGILYNISFSYQKNTYEARLGNTLTSINFITSGEQQEDLIFHLLEYSDTEDLVLAVDYLEELFTAEIIEGLLAHFHNLLKTLLQHGNVPLQKQDYLSVQEKQLLLNTFNNTDAAYPSDKTLVELFEAQVARTPDHIALVFNDASFTYRELNERANQLGAYLREQYHVHADDLIGVQLHRSEQMIIALLGVLKSGGAYVPVDPGYPQERIDYMLEDSGCKALLDAAGMEGFMAVADNYSGENLPLVNKPTDLVYVIYTSGSTGRPKGCMLEHRGVINRIEWMWSHYGFCSDDIILQKTTFTFDVSVWELWMPLCWGTRMVLCQQDDISSPDRITELISREGVTCLHFVPSMLQAFLSSQEDRADLADQLQSLRRVITSGEALPAETVNSWYELVDVPVHNLYGPTEASVDVTYYATQRGDRCIPIGRPIWNTSMYVLGSGDQLVPVGVVGEICIGGTGLARGYLNKPELTAEKFVANPFRSGEKIYRTGDLGRWLADGNIEYLGRKDDQVKIRGYRIELGEIEAALQGYEGISAAAVIARAVGSGEKELVAYVVGGEALQASALRAYLGSLLPAYMVPGYYVQLEALPLSPNGKLDRKRLPSPEGMGLSGSHEYIAPRSETEKQLVHIWESILGKQQIGIKDNFFELGGHSLKATRLASQIHKVFQVKLSLKELFSATVLEDQALLIGQAAKSRFTAISRAPEQTSYPLSSAQRRLWVLSQFEEGSTAYNMPGCFEFSGALDVAALERSFARLIARHESLRTVFREDEHGEVRQYIEASGFGIRREDHRGATAEQLQALVTADVMKAFDLGCGPLLRASLYQVATNRWIFTYVMHHIISDGWSMQVLVGELLDYYRSYTSGKEPEVSALPLQYKDYAVWQQEQLNAGVLQADKVYWEDRLSGSLPVLGLSGDHVRPAVKSYRGGRSRFLLNEELTGQLKQLLQVHDSTLFMGLLAGVQTLLYRYTGQEDLIIGSPVAGRGHADLSDQIGFYVNTLALRTQLSGSDSYEVLLGKVRELTLEAYDHQHYPFDELVEGLQLERDLSRSPLFDVMVIMQNNEGSGTLPELPGVNIRPYMRDGQVQSKFDLTFSFVEQGEGLQYEIEYNSDIYEGSTIDRLGRHLEQLLGAIAAAPAMPLGTLDYLDAAEKEQLLQVFNDTAHAYPSDKTLVELFEAQVARTPEHIALVFNGTSFTYRELNTRANQLGAYLREQYHVHADDLIGVQLHRSEQMIIALLGVLKSGGAYVPVDPGYPQERIDYMLEDSGCKALLDAAAMEGFMAVADNYSGEDLPLVNEPADLVYVIYTSGSTGRPKGVMVENRNLVNYLTAINDLYHVKGDDRILQASNFSFDASVEQIFLSLVYGATLYVIPADLLVDDAALNVFIEENAITHLHSVPALLERIDVVPDSSLRRIISAGEDCPASLLNKWYSRVNFYNKYGPTEATISSTIFQAKAQTPLLSKVPIGSPVSNKIYIVDEQGLLVPAGVAGELCISGAGIARGYLNKPELTAEKFVSDPFRAGERMYRTGDLARWLADGNIEYLGRKDDQVKIRGYRIELGEIEAALQGHEGISAAAVIARVTGSGEKELVAYVVGDEALQASVLRTYLGSLLPAYMVPGYYVQLASLPLSPNGKLDRKRLPSPEGMGLTNGHEYIAPRTATEKQLVEIWESILDKQQIGIKDNFFELGGHSLKATRLASQIHKVFHVKLSLKELFSATVLEDQALLIGQAAKSRFTAISRAPEQTSYPLSSAQRRLWVLSQFEEGSTAYNMPGCFEFSGALDVAALERSFAKLIDRHESLRTVFREDEQGEVRQYIEASGFGIRREDHRGATAEQLQALVTADVMKAFDLGCGPLLRASLYQVATNRWIFTYVMHHIISDGWSMQVLVGELLDYYRSYTSGKEPEVSALPLQYKDYAVWQQEQLNAGVLQADKVYWEDRLSGSLPVLGLSGDHVRPAVKSYRGGRSRFLLNEELTGQLKQLLQVHDSTLFMGLLAGVQTLLYRYTGQEDLIIGSPVAGRGHADLSDQIGFYVNTLALRTQLSGSDSYEVLLGRVRELTLEAYDHQHYPFDELVESLQLERDLSRSPLFDVMVIMQNNEGAGTLPELPGVNIRPYMREGQVQSKFDLTFSFVEQGEGLQYEIEYNSDIYEGSTIDRLGRHLEQLLGAIAAAPAMPLGTLDYLDAAEKEQLLQVFNDTAHAYPSDKTLVELFEAQVARTPEHIALVFNGTSFTYSELNTRANQLGAYLREQYHVHADDLIGVQLHRSEQMIIALLGVLKSGGAYVPVDPGYPQERIDYMLEDSGCKALLDAAAMEGFMAVADNYSGEDLPLVNKPTDLVYVIYTSGSTGRPKGCMLEHRGVINRIEWMWSHYGFCSDDIILQKTTFTFDVSVWELWMPLCWGTRMVLCQQDDISSPDRITELISREGVTCLHFVPSMLQAFLSSQEDRADLADQLQSLRRVITSGEALPAATVNSWYELVDVPVHNLYGPTEASVDVTYYATQRGDRRIPIGRPIWNTSMYVLGSGDQLAPVGVVGEICIGGTGLARGYLNKPELTAEKFVANPYRIGEKIYRTGDLGRWLADGNIEYLGRKDDQVKIRGYRIELGEIEAALQEYEGISAAAVIARAVGSGEKELVAYVVGDEALQASALRAYLGSLLPAYMVPGYYVQLEALPLSPNGKLDRKRLPSPEGMGLSGSHEYIAPRSETEKQLVHIWESILGKQQIGIKDNFFELGGHSLKATRLASQIHKVFHVKLSLKELFTATIPEDQAALIDNAVKSRFTAISRAPEQVSYPLSSAQRRLWVLSQFEEGSTAYNMPGCFEFSGELDVVALERSFARLIARHESLRTVFREDEHGEVRQYIIAWETAGFRIGFEDLRGVAAGQLDALVALDVMRAFDLVCGPLLRASLYQVDGNRWIFTYVMHHIISDGWSMQVLVGELLNYYRSYTAGKEPEVSALPLQYKDYAVWQQEQLNGGVLQADKVYWEDRLSGSLPVLGLSGDHVRPAVKSYRGGRSRFLLNEALTDQLKQLLQEHDCTLFMGLLAGVQTLLYRYSGQEDLIIGSPVAGRGHADLSDQIGFYVNTLALRTRLSGSDSYEALLGKVRELTLEAYDHQHYPFDELVEGLPLERDLSRSPLFDVMVVLQNNEGAGFLPELPGLSIRPYTQNGQVQSRFDLLFHFTEVGTGLEMVIEFNSDIYEKSTIDRLGTHLELLLENMTISPQMPLGELDYLGTSEKLQLLGTFNNTAASYPADKTIVDLFREQVMSTPEHTAIYWEGRSISYRELDEHSNQLAHYLKVNYPIGPDNLIAIKMERSDAFIIAILAVLKAGAAYLPIDPNYPAERVAYLEKDSNCVITIDFSLYTQFLKQRARYSILPLFTVIRPDNLVYLIYTSGSTGNPKGIMMTHRAMLNLMMFHVNEFAPGEVKKVLQCASVSFDVSFQEIFSTLLAGAALYPITEDSKKDVTELVDFVTGNSIDTMFLPTAYFKLLMEEEYFLTLIGLSVRHIIVAGEQLVLGEAFIAYLKTHNLVLHNHYGPAETHVVTTIRLSKEQSATLKKIPSIGKPVSNNEIYILDSKLSLVPVGVIGELCIGGVGVARGYLNKPELTAEKFVANPFRAGERMYRTGDLARWLADGSIEYLGRKDDQVKIRGFRIEPGEIETALQGHGSVTTAAVIARAVGSGEKELVAYVVGGEALQASTLRAYLGSLLPAYMVPGYFVQLEALPLSPNGKLDRKRLPSPEGMGLSGSHEYVAPRSETEKQLVEIWESILGKQQISIKDNFFELGGHSLKATRLASQIHKSFQVKLSLKELFSATVLEDQALLIGQAAKSRFTAISRAPEQASYPLSSAQRRLWVLSQFEEGSTAYNMPGCFEFSGALDVVALERSFARLIDRHESLRTVFREDEQGEVRQYIEASGFGIHREDQQGATAGQLQALVTADVMKAFDLGKGPLLRASLYQVAANRWIFTYVMHHIISDGWSMQVLVSELLDYYRSYTAGREPEVSPLPLQYKDYAVWQQEQLGAGVLQADKVYWEDRLSGSLPVLALSGDHVRPAVKSYRGGRSRFMLNEELTGQLKQLLQSHDCTLFMGLLAGVQTLLYRYTGQEDLIIGSPVAGRGHADLSAQIGFYVNTLALRTQLNGSDSYEALLGKVRELTLEAYDHQHYPFDELVEGLQLERDLSRSPLFDVMVIMQNNEGAGVLPELPGVNIRPYMREGQVQSKFDLTFSFVEQGEGLQYEIEYNSDIYELSTIERLGIHLAQLLSAIAAAPAMPLGRLDYLDASEKEQLLSGFNATTHDYPSDKTLVELFEEQVSRTPGNVALVFNGTSFTYRELNERANQLGAYLREQYHIRPDDLVGVQLQRSEEMIIALLGVLKSGGAYVPIDPGYPQERIDYMLEDSGCKTLLDAAAMERFTAVAGNYSCENLPLVNQPTDLVYVIYTSGSTGRPKGVMIENRSVNAFIDWCMEEFRNDNFDIVFAVTSICFDLSVFEIFYTLCTGKKLKLLENALSIRQHLDTSGHILLNTVPSVVAMLLAEDADLSRVSVLNMAGEPIPGKTIERLDTDNTVCRNLYGPSEDTTYSTVYKIQHGNKVLIGKPITNTSIYILDDSEQLLPVGVPGEICISGAGLARGYLHKPGLTAEKFVNDPFHAGERMYKTGDLGRWMPDGNIEFLGRKDNQVKVRGFRIELGEIETVLQGLGDIEAAVVTAVVNSRGEKELAAYFVSQHPQNITGIKSRLGRVLPGYMVPDHYVQLEEMPYTATGKIDRKKLPDPQGLSLHPVVEYIAPATDIQKKLVLIWQEILGKEQIGIRDNFFDLGGHSLKVTRLASYLHKAFETRIPLHELFAAPVLEDQARLLEQARKTAFLNIECAAPQPGYPLSSAQQLIWISSQSDEASKAYNMPAAYILEGTLDRTALEYAFNRLIARHESLRTVFRKDGLRGMKQFILPQSSAGFNIAYSDLRQDEEQDKSLKGLIYAAATDVFNLSAGPLLRAGLYQLENNKWVFIYTMHHIITDGWSMNVLLKELLLIYEAYTKGEEGALSPLRIQYKDYAVWQQQQMNKASLVNQRTYWLKQFEGELPVLQLPVDYPRPDMKTYKGGSVRKAISLQVSNDIKNIAQERGSTLFMGLLSAVNMLLHNYTGQEDIIIGSPVAGREHIDLEGQIGFYVNTLALRTQFRESNTYLELLEQVRQITLGAYEHQVYPFDRLVADLGLQGEGRRNNLFDVSLILQNAGPDLNGVRHRLKGLSIAPYQQEGYELSKFDLTFFFIETPEGLQASIKYNTDLFRKDTIRQMLDNLEKLLTEIAVNPLVTIQQPGYSYSSPVTAHTADVDYSFKTAISDEF